MNTLKPDAAAIEAARWRNDLKCPDCGAGHTHGGRIVQQNARFWQDSATCIPCRAEVVTVHEKQTESCPCCGEEQNLTLTELMKVDAADANLAALVAENERLRSVLTEVLAVHTWPDGTDRNVAGSNDDQLWQRARQVVTMP